MERRARAEVSAGKGVNFRENAGLNGGLRFWASGKARAQNLNQSMEYRVSSIGGRDSRGGHDSRTRGPVGTRTRSTNERHGGSEARWIRERKCKGANAAEPRAKVKAAFRVAGGGSLDGALVDRLISGPVDQSAAEGRAKVQNGAELLCKSAKVDATKSRGGGGKRLAAGSGRDAADAMSSHPYPRQWQRPTKGRIQTRAARGAAPTLTQEERVAE